MRLPDPCLVLLVGATASGKSHWAAEWFHPDQVVSSDRLRAMVGAGERDQRAGGDAFEVLDLIVAKRMRRGLTTVIDSTGLDAGRREAWRALAGRHGVPVHAVLFDAPAKLVRERNRARGQPVPSKVVTAQLAAAAEAADALAAEGYAGVHRPGPVDARPARPRERARRRRPPGCGADGARLRPPDPPLRLPRPPRDDAAARSPTSRAPPRRPASRASG